MNESMTPNEARDSRQTESEGRVALQRLVRQTWETFDKRAATWARDEGELGSIVDVEIRTLNTTWLEVSERLLSSPNPLGEARCSALTLRDYFVVAVMQGWQACSNTNARTPEAVKYCYEVADEMLKQRDGQRSDRASAGSVMFWGVEYPIIAPLDGAFFLVAHPNGPAICGHEWLSVIDQRDDDPARAKQLKRLATEKFREWAWSKLRAEFYSPNA